MINYLKEFEDALDDFLEMTICFNENQIRYKFQGFWTSSHFEKDIQKKAKNLENLLFRQLKNGLDNKALLFEVQSKMAENFNILYNIYYLDYDDLTKSNLKVRYTPLSPEISFADTFTYEFFSKLISDTKRRDEFQSENTQFTTLSNSLLELFDRFKNCESKKPTTLQFENVKLLDCIYSYRVVMFDLLEQIGYCYQNFEKIDFTKVEQNEFPQRIESVKCSLNLSKIEAAKLFSFLIYDGIMFIDPTDEKRNKIKVQNFIEKNFTYRSLNSEQQAITKINREISEFQLFGRKEYNNAIDDFIKILESKKKV